MGAHIFVGGAVGSKAQHVLHGASVDQDGREQHSAEAEPGQQDACPTVLVPTAFVRAISALGLPQRCCTPKMWSAARSAAG